MSICCFQASILQQTSDYILTLQGENAQLIQKNLRLQQLLESKETGTGAHGNSPAAAGVANEGETPGLTSNPNANNNNKASRGTHHHHEPLAPPKKRKKFETTGKSHSVTIENSIQRSLFLDSSDEGIGVMSDGDTDRGVSPRILTNGQTQNVSSAQSAASSRVSVDSNGNSPLGNFETTPVVDVKPSGAAKIDSMWGMELVQRQLIDLRMALERERRGRLMLEDHLRSMEINSRLNLQVRTIVIVTEYFRTSIL